MPHLVQIPFLLQLAILVVPSVILSLVGLHFFRKSFEHHKRAALNEVAGVNFAVIGGIYGVVMAFAMVGIWERFQEARYYTEAEADSVADLGSLATAMGMQQVSENCKLYLEIVINEEWKLMDHLKHSRKAEAVLDSIQLKVFSFKPSNLQEQSLFSAILTELNNLTDARLNRISRITDTMPWQMWFFLIPVGFVVVCYSHLFGIESGRAHMFMTAALALSIAYSLVITFNLQYPFSGALKVKPEAYEMVLAESFESIKPNP